VHRLLILLALVIPFSVRAQQADAGLDAAAEQARRAWFGHNAAALVADSPRLLV